MILEAEEICMLHYNLFKKKVKKNILHQIFGYLLILVFLLIVCLIVKQTGMVIFFITYLIIIFYPVIKLISSYFKVNKTISKKEEKLINLELSNNILFEGRDYTLTLNYFIDNNNFNFIKYGDILLIETTKKLGLGALFDTPLEVLYISTKDGNYSFIIKDFFLLNNNDVYCENLSDFIKIKNPNVLIGNYEENRKIIKEKIGVIIKKNWKKYFKIILDVR